jgi:hypothetical protein
MPAGIVLLSHDLVNKTISKFPLYNTTCRCNSLYLVLILRALNKVHRSSPLKCAVLAPVKSRDFAESQAADDVPGSHVACS